MLLCQQKATPKFFTGLEGSKAWFGNHTSALICCCLILGADVFIQVCGQDSKVTVP